MKVPGHIKTAIKRVAYHNAIANKNDSIVRSWLIENNIIDDDGENLLELYISPFCIDNYIDECEMGIGDGSDTIKKLEEIEDIHYKEIESNEPKKE